MTFKQEIIERIGEDIFKKLEKEAEIEVGLAKEMPLKNKYGQDNYYHERYLIPDLQKEFEIFSKNGLSISPTDVINVLFKSKMLFAVSTEEEYRTRTGSISHVDEYKFAIPRNKKIE